MCIKHHIFKDKDMKRRRKRLVRKKSVTLVTRDSIIYLEGKKKSF